MLEHTVAENAVSAPTALKLPEPWHTSVQTVGGIFSNQRFVVDDMTLACCLLWCDC